MKGENDAAPLRHRDYPGQIRDASMLAKIRGSVITKPGAVTGDLRDIDDAYLFFASDGFENIKRVCLGTFDDAVMGHYPSAPSAKQ